MRRRSLTREGRSRNVAIGDGGIGSAFAFDVAADSAPDALGLTDDDGDIIGADPDPDEDFLEC